MTDDRPRSFSQAFVFAALAAATTWAALVGWRDFVLEPSTYLRPLLWVGVLVATLGALLRTLGSPRPVTVLLQVVATSSLVLWQVTGSVLPVGGAGGELVEALRDSITTARDFAAPIGPSAPPVWPLIVAVGACFMVLVDAVAATFAKVAAAGLVLLAAYSVPSGLLAEGPDPASFTATAIGFLLLLHLDARAHLVRWGRPVGPSDDTSAWRNGNPVGEAVRAGAGRIGLVAVVLALLLAPLVPVLGTNLLDVGSGNGDGDIRIRRPVTDMRRDLERGLNRDMVWLTTDDPNPSYLRIAVLNRYTGNEWSSGDRDVPSGNRADGELPRPTGMSPDVPTTSHDYTVVVDEGFDSTWLPTQFPAAAVSAPGDWRFDTATMDFLSRDPESLDTRDIRYTMTSLDPTYGTDGQFFRDAQAATVPTEVLALPAGVPEIASDLARSVTEPATDDYERALLLQRWFRTDGGFEYSLDQAPRGQGNGTLERFLSRDGRVGYCEQFASAMAVMARTLGIPARVAVGFLSPERVAGTDDTWVYRSHDLHAWPELYFAGAGWVRFEPTPSGRVASVPAYTRVDVGAIGEDPTALPAGPSDNATSSNAPGQAPTRAPVPDEGTTSDDPSATGPSPWLVGAATALAGLLLAALVVGIPVLWRNRSRRERLAGGPESVWSEVRAHAIDLGLPWPEDRSPREVRAVLREHLADPASPGAERPATGPHVAVDADAALDRLLVGVERSRYGRPGSVAVLERAADPGDDARLVTASLEAGVSPSARRRARWLPRSVWRRSRRS